MAADGPVAHVEPGGADRGGIEIRGVAKGFAARGRVTLALEEVSLTIRDKEFVALVGPSGCGKSTLLNMIAGLVIPTRGEIRCDGAPVRGLNVGIGYMTQKDTLLPWRTVEDNVAIPLEIAGLGRNERNRRVGELLDLVNLRGFERHYPGELSGGMRRRVALARTLSYDPKTLLMDEPFGALDAQLKLVMQNELLRIWDVRKKTVVFVTHDLGEAIALADRVVVFSSRPGRIKTVKDVLLPRPRDVFQVRFTEAFGRLSEELWGYLREEVGREERLE